MLDVEINIIVIQTLQHKDNYIVKQICIMKGNYFNIVQLQH